MAVGTKLARSLLAVLVGATACASTSARDVRPATSTPASKTAAASAAGIVDGPGVASTIVAVPPARVLDTRDAVNGEAGRRIAAYEQVSLPIAGRAGVPADAGGVLVNVVATESLGPGYVTVWPCGESPPLASNLNYRGGQTIANQSFARVGAGGTICLLSSQQTHLVVDVAGYTPASSPVVAGQPARLLDTRAPIGVPQARKIGAGEEVRVSHSDGEGPAQTVSVALNVTVTEPDAAGYLTVWPCGSPPPTASNLNFTAGETIANLVVSGVSSVGEVCLAPSQPTHIVVDIDGDVVVPRFSLERAARAVPRPRAHPGAGHPSGVRRGERRSAGRRADPRTAGRRYGRRGPDGLRRHAQLDGYGAGGARLDPGMGVFVARAADLERQLRGRPDHRRHRPRGARPGRQDLPPGQCAHARRRGRPGRRAPGAGPGRVAAHHRPGPEAALGPGHGAGRPPGEDPGVRRRRPERGVVRRPLVVLAGHGDVGEAHDREQPAGSVGGGGRHRRGARSADRRRRLHDRRLRRGLGARSGQPDVVPVASAVRRRGSITPSPPTAPRRGTRAGTRSIR